MGLDKILHVVAGFVICMLTGSADPTLGIMAAGLAGGLKELLDGLLGTGDVELADFVATFAGGMIGFFVLLLNGTYDLDRNYYAQNPHHTKRKSRRKKKLRIKRFISRIFRR